MPVPAWQTPAGWSESSPLTAEDLAQELGDYAAETAEAARSVELTSVTYDGSGQITGYATPTQSVTVTRTSGSVSSLLVDGVQFNVQRDVSGRVTGIVRV